VDGARISAGLVRKVPGDIRNPDKRQPQIGPPGAGKELDTREQGGD